MAGYSRSPAGSKQEEVLSQLRLSRGDRVRLNSVRYGQRVGVIRVVSPNRSVFHVELQGKLPKSIVERTVLATRGQLTLVR